MTGTAKKGGHRDRRAGPDAAGRSAEKLSTKVASGKLLTAIWYSFMNREVDVQGLMEQTTAQLELTRQARLWRCVSWCCVVQFARGGSNCKAALYLQSCCSSVAFERETPSPVACLALQSDTTLLMPSRERTPHSTACEDHCVAPTTCEADLWS